MCGRDWGQSSEASNRVDDGPVQVACEASAEEARETDRLLQVVHIKQTIQEAAEAVGDLEGTCVWL